MEAPDSARRLAALVDVGIALASELDLDSLLQRIADLSRDVIDARYGAVGVVDETGRLMRFVHSGVDEATVQRIGHLPEGRGVLGLVVGEGKPIRLSEIRDHPNSYGFPDHHPEMHSFLGVPISVRGQVFGRLYLTEKQGASEFSEDDERIALMLAAQAGVAVENARLTEALRDLAVLEERDRISKDLHDGVIQSIYSVGLSLQGSMSLVERDPNAAKARIDEAIAELDNVVRDVRSYIFELRPKRVEQEGLASAIRELARELEVNTLAHTIVEVDEKACQTLSEHHQGHVLHIVREILSNVARHAKASEIEIRLSGEDGEVVLVVEDDGVGFDPSSAVRGQGLANIEERANRLGGKVEIAPRNPKGTHHELRVRVGRGRHAGNG